MEYMENIDKANIASSSNTGQKREGIDMDDDWNPYAEFCGGGANDCPRKKMKTLTNLDSQLIHSKSDTNDVITETTSTSQSEMEQGVQQGQCDEGPVQSSSAEDNDSPDRDEISTIKTVVPSEKKTLIGNGLTFPCQGPGCHEEFKCAAEHDIHYRARHCNICTECKRSLKSRHLLDLHLMEKHDSYFAAMSLKKPSFVCLIETCNGRFMNPEERKIHCLAEHPFLKNFLQNASDSKIIAVDPFVSEVYSVPVRKGSKVIKMEEDGIENNELISTFGMEPSQQSKTKKIVPEKKKSCHISFGHHGERFIPRQVFAMQKKKNPDKKSNMDTVDLSDLQKSLQF